MSVRSRTAARPAAVAKAFTGAGSPASQGQAPVNVPAVMQQAATDVSQMGFEHTFAPGFPIGPYDGYQRHPRQQDFVTGYNIATRPRTNERVSFDTLYGLISNYDIAQMCIYHRIDSVRSLDWKLVAKEGYEGDVDDAIATGMAALKKPDRERTFDNWLSAWLFDVLGYDAGALYRLRNRGGKAIGLLSVDGKTIAPLLDYWGMRPEAPAEAYVQYVQGLPWNWLTQDDMIYQPMRPHNDSPYGHAPIEIVMLNANTDIRFQLYFLERFTEGNIPEAFASAPETWTPQIIEQFQEYWDGFMYGDQSRKHQIRWIPGGSSFAWSNEKDFSDQFSLFLMRKTCAAFHVVPSDLGFTENVNRSSGESQADVQHRVGDLPLLNYVEGILDDFLQDDLLLPISLKFDRGEEQVDQVAQAQADKIYVDMGAVSPSHLREIRYGLTEPDGQPVPRYIMTSRGGPVPLASLMAVAGQIDPATGAPAPGAELPHKVFGGTEGVLANPPIRVMSLAEQEFGPSAMPPAPPPQPKMTPQDVGLPGVTPQATVAKDGEAGSGIGIGNGGDGITSGTGIYSDPLSAAGNRLDPNDDEQAAARAQTDEARGDQVAKGAEIAAFRRYVRGRRKAGTTWRDFRFTVVDEPTAAQLNAEGRAQVTKADYGPAVDKRVVYRQLARNYDPKGIAWVLDTTWYGPVDVPLADVDTANIHTWSASQPGDNQAHVRRFEEQITAGNEPAPVVMVHVAGKHLLVDVDGHHRYEAFASLGLPVPAYVGMVADDTADAPWAKTHLYQIHAGGDPLNKAAAADGGALAFLLMRAPNDQGKQRYLLQKRGDAGGGQWGLPGGHAHPGEDLWAAAVRESVEEMGYLPDMQRGPALAWDQDGQTVHTFLVQLAGQFTPDVARSATPDESAGWGWFSRSQVGKLDLHPAMAATWAQLGAAGLDEPGSDWSHVSKASGYELSPRSGMISLDVPAGLVDPLPGGVEDLHVTVVYLGPDVDDDAFATACLRAQVAAQSMGGPLDGTISGIGCFPPSASSDGRIPAWAAVAIPGAEQLRAALEDLSASEHKNWAPHMTLAYLEPGEPLPYPLDPVDVTFAYLSVHRGGEVARYPLGPAEGDEDCCPCGTPVVYDEANGWQHADGSISHDDGESVSDKMRAVLKATALGKLTQAEVHYGPATTPDRRCATCVMFRLVEGVPSCTLVADPISPDGVCDRWYPAKDIPDGGSDGGTAITKAGGPGPKAGNGRRWPGWDLDEHTAAHWGGNVTAAARQSLASSRLGRVAAAYLGAHAAQVGDAPDKRERNDAAAAWLTAWLARDGHPLDMTGLGAGIVADGQLIGVASAAALLDDTRPQLGGWQPGDTTKATAALAALGVAQALASDTAGGPAVDVEQALADGITGAVARTLAGADGGTDAGALAGALADAIADDSLTTTLVLTQITTLTGQAALGHYLKTTTDTLQWVAVDDSRTCPRCMTNAAASPRKAGEAWPSGDLAPPAHPGGCRCALVPDWA